MKYKVFMNPNIFFTCLLHGSFSGLISPSVSQAAKIFKDKITAFNLFQFFDTLSLWLSW